MSQGSRRARLAILVATAPILLGACRRGEPLDQAAASSSAVSARQSEDASPSATTSPPALAPSSSAPTPSSSAPASSPEMMSLLDPGKGRRALGDYRRALANLCASLQKDAGSAAGELQSVGLPGADPIALCVDTGAAGEALASGSFDQANADEVLLVGPSGMDRAAGDHAIVVMRSDGTRYRWTPAVTLGNDRFEARARIAVPGGPDALMLCHRHGQQGVYGGRCGFLGRGYFQSGAPGPGAHDEIELVQGTICGSGTSVDLGDVTLQGTRLRVEVVMKRFVLEPNSPAERGEGLCTRKVEQGEQRFGVDFEREHGHFQRVTPIPEAVAAALRAQHG